MVVPLYNPDGDRLTCDYCQAHVSRSFRRTYGTDQGRVKRCPDCDSWPRIEQGSARGKDVDHPDPQVHADRNGGQFAANRGCIYHWNPFVSLTL